jgi:hypothetical protein
MFKQVQNIPSGPNPSQAILWACPRLSHDADNAALILRRQEMPGGIHRKQLKRRRCNKARRRKSSTGQRRKKRKLSKRRNTGNIWLDLR